MIVYIEHRESTALMYRAIKTFSRDNEMYLTAVIK